MNADFIVKIHDSPECRGQVLNVATGKETSINEIVHRLLVAMGQPDYPVIYGPERPGDVRRHCADVSRLTSLIGSRPADLSDDALHESVEWYNRV